MTCPVIRLPDPTDRPTAAAVLAQQRGVPGGGGPHRLRRHPGLHDTAACMRTSGETFAGAWAQRHARRREVAPGVAVVALEKCLSA